MLTLYGSKGSGSAAVECALEHCGLPWRIVQAATWEPDSALAELRRFREQLPQVLSALPQMRGDTAVIHRAMRHLDPGEGQR